jgi:hypothetical protein
MAFFSRHSDMLFDQLVTQGTLAPRMLLQYLALWKEFSLPWQNCLHTSTSRSIVPIRHSTFDIPVCQYAGDNEERIAKNCQFGEG